MHLRWLGGRNFQSNLARQNSVHRDRRGALCGCGAQLPRPRTVGNGEGRSNQGAVVCPKELHVHLRTDDLQLGDRQRQISSSEPSICNLCTNMSVCTADSTATPSVRLTALHASNLPNETTHRKAVNEIHSKIKK